MFGYLLWSLVPLAIAAILGGLSWICYSKAPRRFGMASGLPFGAAVVLGFSSALVLIFGGVFSIINVWTYASCKHQAERMGLEWDYSAWTPCLVRLPDGRWVDIDDIENNHLTGEVVVKSGED